MVDDVVVALAGGLEEVGVPSYIELGGGDWAAVHVDLVSDRSITICVFDGKFWFAFHSSGLYYRSSFRSDHHVACLRRWCFELDDPGVFDRVVRLVLMEIEGEILWGCESMTNADWTLERRLGRLRERGLVGSYLFKRPYYLV